MKLIAYLEENDLFPEEFANLIGVSKTSVYNWLYGNTTPIKTYKNLINKFTKGKVGLKDWKHTKDEIRIRSDDNGDEGPNRSDKAENS